MTVSPPEQGDRGPTAAPDPRSRAETLESVEVVVVGAGIAGLAVARSLVAGGRSVLVLESRDRVGGRLHSVELADGSGLVDLGATWFWPGEHRVVNLIDQLGLATHDQHLTGDAVYHDPAGSPRIDGNPIDVPAGRFTDGAQALAEAVAAELPPGTVRLKTPVTAVTAVRTATAVTAVRTATEVTAGPSASEVTSGQTTSTEATSEGAAGLAGSRSLLVHHPAGPLAADHVVLALPPALAVSRINFDPPLPERLAGLAAITPVWMGATIKVVAHYGEPFWRQAGLAGSAISHHGPMREVHDMSGPDGDPAALFGFVPARPTGPPPTESEIRQQLVQLFGPEAGRPRQVIIADWRHPDTSPAGVERLNAYQAFGHALYQTPTFDGRLHFASTETSTIAPGHIEGALAAAERSVAAITATDPVPAPSAAQTRGATS